MEKPEFILFALKLERFLVLMLWINLLIKASSGDNDYINASHVNMNQAKAMSSDQFISRKWIAAQGPLQGTLKDFWRMIYQR